MIVGEFLLLLSCYTVRWNCLNLQNAPTKLQSIRISCNLAQVGTNGISLSSLLIFMTKY